jgi:hypothetical protein
MTAAPRARIGAPSSPTGTFYCPATPRPRWDPGRSPAAPPRPHYHHRAEPTTPPGMSDPNVKIGSMEQT